MKKGGASDGKPSTHKKDKHNKSDDLKKKHRQEELPEQCLEDAPLEPATAAKDTAKYEKGARLSPKHQPLPEIVASTPDEWQVTQKNQGEKRSAISTGKKPPQGPEIVSEEGGIVETLRGDAGDIKSTGIFGKRARPDDIEALVDPPTSHPPRLEPPQEITSLNNSNIDDNRQRAVTRNNDADMTTVATSTTTLTSTSAGAETLARPISHEPAAIAQPIEIPKPRHSPKAPQIREKDVAEEHLSETDAETRKWFWRAVVVGFVVFVVLVILVSIVIAKDATMMGNKKIRSPFVRSTAPTPQPSSTTFSVGSDQCTLCADPTEQVPLRDKFLFNQDGTDVTCGDIALQGLGLEKEACEVHQSTGSLECGCSSRPSSTVCFFCDRGTIDTDLADILGMTAPPTLSLAPSVVPTHEPSLSPTTPMPSDEPTLEPSWTPSRDPTQEPTGEPTNMETTEPTVEPTAEPTALESFQPSSFLTLFPTGVRPGVPTEAPTNEPTKDPTRLPTTEPTKDPTLLPTAEPTKDPTRKPTLVPTLEPTFEPTIEPTNAPTLYCPLCVDGSPLESSLESAIAVTDSFTCGQVDSFLETATSASLSATSCFDFQVIGIARCGCPVTPHPDAECWLCASGGLPPNLDLVIGTDPDGNDFTCFRALSAAAQIRGNAAECRSVVEAAGPLCGC